MLSWRSAFQQNGTCRVVHQLHAIAQLLLSLLVKQAKRCSGKVDLDHGQDPLDG
jgi:hypothetical protein